ncbi:CoA-transferase family III domain-containing protein [Crucibulum laeve]|uniref:CoA-transferase family III domain-containing protein n=1 Tax=Crucibulum laeve TaxID=68775 RepID=A0A5C3LJ47_9AGAR|nr:CoA-transferase family III domain-containing protein [Crucibulum laeve]
MDQYSVPSESKKLLLDGLIHNPLHNSSPKEIEDAAANVDYVGSDLPVIPINWRFAESISALKGFQGSMLNVLLKRKYGIPYQRIIINTDHAQLFIMSALLPVIDPYGSSSSVQLSGSGLDKYFPSCDKHNAFSPTTPPFDHACTNIYKTKDSRFYHLHGSLNPRICQDALQVSRDDEAADIRAGSRNYQEKLLQYDSAEVEGLLNDQYRQAGTTCWSTDEYRSSAHGKANAHVGLYELHYVPNEKQKATWWHSIEGKTSPTRPLFGLKVIDLTRIIASPAIGRELAEMGASVMRITSPNITDLVVLNFDLGWGKWNAHLDLTKEEDRRTLRGLIEEADVVIDGYRPGVMQKWGFGKDDVLGFFKDKERGVIYAHENCYGWNGPWSHRSGWQQISDANCGVSLEFGRAMGHNEPVTPVFPNSDYCTGAAGSTGIVEALIKRAETGGSYVVDIALNYYSQWLVNTCSDYPPHTWDALWAKYDRPVFHHTDNMGVTIPRYMQMLKEHQAPLFNPSFFEVRENKALGVPARTVKPILEFPEGQVKLGYNVGTRPNGKDKPRWPEDLLTEVVA